MGFGRRVSYWWQDRTAGLSASAMRWLTGPSWDHCTVAVNFFQKADTVVASVSVAPPIPGGISHQMA